MYMFGAGENGGEAMNPDKQGVERKRRSKDEREMEKREEEVEERRGGRKEGEKMLSQEVKKMEGARCNRVASLFWGRNNPERFGAAPSLLAFLSLPPLRTFPFLTKRDLIFSFLFAFLSFFLSLQHFSLSTFSSSPLLPL